MHNLGAVPAWWIIPATAVALVLFWTWALCRAAAKPAPTPFSPRPGSWDEQAEEDRLTEIMALPMPSLLDHQLAEAVREGERKIAWSLRLPPALVEPPDFQDRRTGRT